MEMDRLGVISSSLDKEKRNINSLDDDSLIQIFRYLPVAEKLKTELVCRRWKNLNKFSYDNVKSIRVNFRIEFEKFSLDIFNEKNLAFMANIIKKCKSYLSEVNIAITSSSFKDFKPLLTEIIKCNNITDLRLFSMSKNALTDKNLGTLFTNNKNIRILHLNNLSINGDCLLKLNLDSIVDLELYEMEIKSKICLNDFFYKTKNLEILSLNCSIFHSDVITIAVDVLNRRNHDKITHFFGKVTLFYNKILEQAFLRNLLELMRKQKQILKLTLEGTPIDQKFIDKLPIHIIEELDLKYDNDKTYSFSNLKNIKSLSCNIKQVTNQFLKSISECKGLRKLSIKDDISNDKPALVTPDGLSYLCKIENLEYFEIDGNDIDNFLISLKECKNLKHVKISGSFTYAGLSNVLLLPKLKIFDISNSNLTNNLISYVIKTAVNLEEIYVSGWDKLSKDYIEEAYKIKSGRQDKHVLTIHYQFLKLTGLDRDKISKLILLKEVQLDI